MSVLGNGAAVKRWWLGLTFYPNGGDVAKQLGLVPASDDVEQAELRGHAAAIAKVYARTDFIDEAFIMARWYQEGAIAAAEFGHSLRSPEEHLVSFLVAAVAAGILEVPSG